MVERFITAQSKRTFYQTTFETAYQEIANGKKSSHWMWFIFPQITGLGYSDISKYYSIKSIEETKAYYQNEYLKANLLKITNKLLELNTRDIVKVFGSIDANKLKSSMTLFYIVTNEKIFKDVLNKYYSGALCKKTVQIINMMMNN